MGVQMEALLQTRFEITTAHDIFDSHLRLGQAVRVRRLCKTITTLRYICGNRTVHLIVMIYTMSDYIEYIYIYYILLQFMICIYKYMYVYCHLYSRLSRAPWSGTQTQFPVPPPALYIGASDPSFSLCVSVCVPKAMLPSSVVQRLLSDASSGSMASGGGALPTTLFDEILVHVHPCYHHQHTCATRMVICADSDDPMLVCRCIF